MYTPAVAMAHWRLSFSTDGAVKFDNDYFDKVNLTIHEIWVAMNGVLRCVAGERKTTGAIHEGRAISSNGRQEESNSVELHSQCNVCLFSVDSVDWLFRS